MCSAGVDHLEVYTIQMAQWRLLKNTDVELLDITLKSGNKAFAPSPSLLKGYKAGLITDKVYTEHFKELMLMSQEENLDEWTKVLSMGRVCLMCYCGKGVFCHRHLVAEYLEELGTELGMLVVLKGEVTKETKLNKREN